MMDKKINCEIEITEDKTKGNLLGKTRIKTNKTNDQTVSIDLKNTSGDKNIFVVFKGKPNNLSLIG